MTLTCTVCQQPKGEKIPATGHTVVIDKAVKPSCLNAGKTEGSHCSTCKAVLTAQKPVKALGHQWDAGKVTKAATCTKEGAMVFTCTVCGQPKGETIPAAGHTVVIDKAVKPTCLNAGKTEGSHCSTCKTVLVAQKTVKALGHQWDEGKVTRAATCTKEGAMAFTCTVCHQPKGEPIPLRTRGDGDNDGAITSADARLALRTSVGLEAAIVKGTGDYDACDADGDGTVTSGDARLILRASVGLEDASKFGKMV